MTPGTIELSGTSRESTSFAPCRTGPHCIEGDALGAQEPGGSAGPLGEHAHEERLRPGGGILELARLQLRHAKRFDQPCAQPGEEVQ